MQKLIQILSLWLISALFLPSAIQITHHHEYIETSCDHNKQLNELKKPCAVCQFEFSFFVTSYSHQNQVIRYFEIYRGSLTELLVAKNDIYHYSLRAPPPSV